MENGTQMTLQQYMPKICPEPISGVLDSLAKTRALPVREKAYLESGQTYFSQLQTLSETQKKKINPSTYSLKTLKDYSLSIKDFSSLKFSLNWMKSGTMRNGQFSTLNILEFPKTGKECSLLDILESEVDEKYFLTPEQEAKILFTPNNKTDGVQQIGNFMPTKKRSNPNQGRIYDTKGIAPCLNKMDGGGREPHIAVPKFCDLVKGAGLKTTKNARCLQARYHKGISSRFAAGSGVAIPVLTPTRSKKRQNGRRFKTNGEPMFTLTKSDIHGVMIKEATKQGYAIARGGETQSISLSLAVKPAVDVSVKA